MLEIKIFAFLERLCQDLHENEEKRIGLWYGLEAKLEIVNIGDQVSELGLELGSLLRDGAVQELVSF